MRVLCVDPHAEERAQTREILVSSGFDVVDSASLSDARSTLTAGEFDAVVTEYDLPDGTGFELVEETRESNPDTMCLVYTHAEFEDLDTTEFGDLVVEYLPKAGPGAETELVSLLRHSIETRTQVAYPVPDDEQARLDAVDRYRHTDTPTEPFDRLTEIATALFDVDGAAVTLVTDHHVESLSETPDSAASRDREDSLATHAILDEEVTVIEDVAADPRFGGQSDLTPANAGLYAASPIVTQDGYRIGVFAVNDGDPRPFTDRERRLLSLLAAEAMDQLALRRGLDELREGTDD